MKNKSDRISRTNQNWSYYPSSGLVSNYTNGITSTSTATLPSACTSYHLSNSNQFAKSKHVNLHSQCKRSINAPFIPNGYYVTSSSSSTSSFHLKHYFLITFFSTLLYINSLNADFTYDDSRAIKTNQDLRWNTPLSALFKNDFWGTPLTHSGSHKSYRPLCVLSFRFNYYIHQLNPFGYHLFNLILHLLVTLLFIQLSFKLFNQSKRLTIISGLLFATHPIHTEAVSSIVGRADLGAALFFLLSILAYINYCQESDKAWPNKQAINVYLYSTLIFAALSMLTKEYGVTVLAVCAVYHLFIHQKMLPITINHISALFHEKRYFVLREGLTHLFLGTLFLIGFRVYMIGFKAPDFAPADNPAAECDNFLIRTLTFLYLPVFNCWLLIYPRWLSFDWSMDSIPLIRSLNDSRNIASLIFYSSLIVITKSIFNYLQIFSINWSHNGSVSGAFQPNSHYSNHVNLSCHLSSSSFSSLSSSSPSTTTTLSTTTTTTTSSSSSSSSSSSTSSSLSFSIFSFSPSLSYKNPSYPQSLSASKSYHSFCTYFSSLISSLISPSNYSTSYPPQSRSNQAYKVNSKTRPMFNTNSNGFDENNLSSSNSLSNGLNWTSLFPFINNTEESISYSYSQMDSLILSCALIVLPFIPATNLFFYVGFVVAERILYTPSMGYCLLLTIGIERLLKRKSFRSLTFLTLSILLLSFATKTLLRNQDWLTEENLYRSGIQINPPKAYGNLANILSSKGEKTEAEASYRKALSFRSNMADVHYNLGILLQEQGRYTEALESYQYSIKFRPRLAMAHLNMGLVLSYLGRKEEAIEVYKHCASLDSFGLKDPKAHESTRISALFNLGRIYSDKGMYQDAIDIYQDAIQRMPQHYQPQSLYNMLGEAYSKLGKFEDAEHWYKQALFAKNDHIPAHLTYAKLLAKWKRLDEAEQWFLKAEMLAPNDSSVYQHYGQFLSELKRHQEAADVHLKASQLVPNDFEIIFNTANALRQASRNQEAERYYKEAVRLRPNEVSSHMNLGAMLHVNGKLYEAQASYLEALRIKPDDVITQNNLAKLRHLLNNKKSVKR